MESILTPKLLSRSLMLNLWLSSMYARQPNAVRLASSLCWGQQRRIWSSLFPSACYTWEILIMLRRRVFISDENGFLSGFIFTFLFDERFTFENQTLTIDNLGRFKRPRAIVIEYQTNNSSQAEGQVFL